MTSKTFSANSVEAIQTALTHIIKDGFKPTLSIITITNIELAAALCSIFNDYNIAVFGVSSSKKFTEQGIESDEIVVMLMDMNPAYFKIVLNDYTQSSVYDAARSAGAIGKKFFTDPGFIISAADFKMSGEEIIEGFMSAAGNDVTVMGGVAGNPADFSGIIFTNNASSTGGLLALIIDKEKINIKGMAVSGWKPSGTEKQITESEGAWVFTIDNEPAMNVIQKYLGKEITFNSVYTAAIDDTTQPSGLVPLDSGYPLQFQRASGSPLIRPVVLWNTANNSVMVGGNVRPTDKFRFSLPPDFDVIDAVVNTTKNIKEKEMNDVDALIVFSCVGRLSSFGPMISSEIEGLASTWNKPMIGFFSLGEFGKLDDGHCEFHGTTVSWVALKEK
ncbi:MAG: FIST C-terminal domain-containing protein [Bacteroidetes bacterium]|nr:FIST C-terminal domain-containing protein [Bacteroidota bacterium]